MAVGLAAALVVLAGCPDFKSDPRDNLLSVKSYSSEVVIVESRDAVSLRGEPLEGERHGILDGDGEVGRSSMSLNKGWDREEERHCFEQPLVFTTVAGEPLGRVEPEECPRSITILSDGSLDTRP